MYYKFVIQSQSWCMQTCLTNSYKLQQYNGNFYVKHTAAYKLLIYYHVFSKTLDIIATDDCKIKGSVFWIDFIFMCI